MYMTSPVALVLAILAVAALIWIAGEQHRENCISQNRADCSVLPWENGKQPRSPFEGLRR